MSADETLLRALLAELAAAPDGVSLPKLCKRLGIRMSVLLRTLAYLGEDAIGDARGPGWIRTVEAGQRTLAQLTDAGRAVVATLPEAPPDEPPDAPQGGPATPTR